MFTLHSILLASKTETNKLEWKTETPICSCFASVICYIADLGARLSSGLVLLRLAGVCVQSLYLLLVFPLQV